MILFLTGPDSYRVHERRRLLLTAFREKYDEGGNNIAVLSGSDATVEEIISQSRTAGLFSSHRLILLDRPSKAKPAALKRMTEFFAAVELPDDIVLMIIEPELTLEETKERIPAGIAKFVEALTANTAVQVERFPTFTPRERKLWAKHQLDLLDATIEESALTRLLAACGEDTYLLANELNKLASRAAGEPITEEMVAEMTVGSLDVNIFALTDALGEGRGKRALAILEGHFLNGETPAYLFAMLGRHVRLLMAAKGNGDVAPTAQQLTRTHGIHPFVARKVVEQAKRFSAASLMALHNNLLSAEYTMKTTRVDPRVLLERLLVPLAI